MFHHRKPLIVLFNVLLANLLASPLFGQEGMANPAIDFSTLNGQGDSDLSVEETGFTWFTDHVPEESTRPTSSTNESIPAFVRMGPSTPAVDEVVHDTFVKPAQALGGGLELDETDIIDDPPPNTIGDFFGGGSSIATVTRATSFHVPGVRVSGAPGGPNAVYAFEIGGVVSVTPFNDLFTVGNGINASGGDVTADTFSLAEPVPPSGASTSPSSTFSYDGGTVVYTNSTAATTAQPGTPNDGETWFASYSFAETVELPPTPGIAVRRIKIAENNSPLPQDRMYFDFKHFRDVKGSFGDVSRYTYGFEKTFLDGLFSVDTRLPFAGTLDLDQTDAVAGTNAGIRGMVFGNATFIFKGVLYELEPILISAGTGVTVPTGGDSRLFLSDGTQVIAIHNNAVHVMPFFAGLWQPNERYYVQGFLQMDIDVNGNPVYGHANGGALPQIGVLQSSSLLFADLSAGYWLRRDSSSHRRIGGIAAIAELHYNTTTQDADVINLNGISISNRTRRFDVLNATFGVFAEIGSSATITAGMSFPLRSGDDRHFDNEIAVLGNLYF